MKHLVTNLIISSTPCETTGACGYWGCEMYQVIYGSPDAGEDGIYHNDRLVVGAHTLHRHGYELYRVLHWRQAALARLAKELAQ